jgi:hypothetical protein
VKSNTLSGFLPETRKALTLVNESGQRLRKLRHKA